MIADHAASFIRERPGRQPAALLLRIQQCLHITAMHGRIHQGVQWKLCPECIPKTCISEHISLMYLTIIGTEIIRASLFINFIEHPGKKTCPEEAGIKGSCLFFGSTFHFYSAEMFIPDPGSCGFCVFQPLKFSQFSFQCHSSLLL